MAEGGRGPIGIGIEADFGGVEFCLPLVFVIESEARSGSSRDFFFVRRDGCGLPGDGDGDRDFSRSLFRDIVEGRFDVLVVVDDVEAVLPILNLYAIAANNFCSVFLFAFVCSKTLRQQNLFGYGESNPELPRSLRGGNVSRYTIPDTN
jgi:hypothetical protein